MYICICKAVSDQQILDKVSSGAEDISTIQKLLGVGTGCGICKEMAQQVIDEALTQKLIPTKK